jgi:hypothetical protein
MIYTTTDLAKYGHRELDLASNLLGIFKTEKDRTKFFSHDGVRVFFNLYSTEVFLTNSEYDVAMVNEEGFLTDYMTCPECGYEGFEEDFKTDLVSKCCKDYIASI